MPGADRWLWLGGSVFIALLCTGTSWYCHRRAWAERLRTSPLFSPLLHFFRFLYYIGGPFAALLWGRDAVVERWFGLVPLPLLLGFPIAPEERLRLWMDGVQGIGWAAVLGTAAWATLALIGWVTRRRRSEEDHSLLSLLREALFQETHWMFYRNGPVVALGTYWGVWVGLGIAALEAGLNPWWWAALRHPQKRPLTLIRAGMAILSATFYLQAVNLWLSILLHWGVTAGWAGWRAARMPRGDTA
ncbi:MAG: hypothetical protein RML46_06770 [Anaerolineae bacterium]|nr:hypothetical protein [Anaerolineae bacterium]MDW8068597.1 hypothetical protein [Anaerolineae bacterium]